MDYTHNHFNFTAPFAGILGLLLATGYNLAYCILELLDNSISKKSRHIRVELSAEKRDGPLTRITVSDTGTGMDFQQLCESFVISQAPKERDEDDIGKFGVGMKSAIMNMGSNITIISKVSNAKPIVGLNADIDMMKTNNSYKPTFLSEDVSKQFPDCLEASNRDYFKKHDSGTLIQVERIRQLCAIPLKDAYNNLRLMIANSYHTMPEGSTITLETNQGQSIVIKPTDFFYTKDESVLDEKPYTTELHVYERNEGEAYDQIIEVNTTARDLPNKMKIGKSGAPIYYKYRVTPVGQKISAGANMERIAALPTTRLLGVIHIRVIQVSNTQFRTVEEACFGDNLHKDRKGFWFSRGIRSIGFGKRLGKKLHDRTVTCVERQRMHVSFPASLDDLIGSKFNKQMEDNALPSQALTDALFLIYRQVTNPWTAKWKHVSVKEEDDSEQQDEPQQDQEQQQEQQDQEQQQEQQQEDQQQEEESAPAPKPEPKKPKKEPKPPASPVTSEEDDGGADEGDDDLSLSSEPPAVIVNEIVEPPPVPIYSETLLDADIVFAEDDQPVNTLKNVPQAPLLCAWFTALRSTNSDDYKKYRDLYIQFQEFN